jgi:hypothetical protein
MEKAATEGGEGVRNRLTGGEEWAENTKKMLFDGTKLRIY